MTPEFFDGSAAAEQTLRTATALVLDTLAECGHQSPFPERTADELHAQIDPFEPLPADGAPLAEVLPELGRLVIADAARPTDPWCAAHLHAPTLITAAASELAIGVLNQSMDSFDQAPAATYLEDRLVRALAQLLGLPADPGLASGVLTSGGTASNLLGLLLARHRADTDAGARGLPPQARSWRFVASAAAHVSVRQAAAVLGLGRDAVLPIAVDDAGAMRVDVLDNELNRLRNEGLAPVAVVGTAGTTDSGAIDPLAELADRAADHGAWFHVDAAVGAGLALSDRQRPRLAGIERADSVTADLHKLWWQPIGVSALLVRDAATLQGVREPTDYLNREDDTGVLNLVDRTLDTSRRFDALKVVVSVRTHGLRRLGAHVDHVVDLARHCGQLIDESADLELLAPPQTVTVLFRFCPPGWHGRAVDDLNVRLQRGLLEAGQAVIGRTRWQDRVALKLTLVNPLATTADLSGLLDAVVRAGQQLAATPPEAQLVEQRTARPHHHDHTAEVSS